jgi:hypothetical protein
MPAKDGRQNSNEKVKFKSDLRRESAASGRVFRQPQAIADISPASAEGGRGSEGRWSNYFSWLRQWR